MERRGISGGFRLFSAFGISVYLHWTWFLIAYWDLQGRDGVSYLGSLYSSFGWRIPEFLSLFVIVLLHEFGHSLACRSVGGGADRILLWPFGGVAFVSPPPRPGATLWSIAAGPLVNVVLIPILYIAQLATAQANPDLHQLVMAIEKLNIILLVFNMLPIYPLDGGQILQSVLWFAIGRVRSLQVATVIGIVGATAVIVFAAMHGSTWLLFMALMGIFQCVSGWKFASRLREYELAQQQQTDDGSNQPWIIRCPKCSAPPPSGPWWQCECGNTFDTFAERFVCPNCHRAFPVTLCPRCQQASKTEDWFTAALGYRSAPVVTPPPPAANPSNPRAFPGSMRPEQYP